jgi:DNA polymerase-3 subunit delta
MFRLIKEKGVVYESASLKEEEVPAFIEDYLKRKKMKAENTAVLLLVDYLGKDLQKITNELDKLCINSSGDAPITIDLIEKYIGISKDFNVYELQSALLTKNHAKAFRIVDHFNRNPKVNPFVLTIANILTAYQRLYHYLIGGDVGRSDTYRVYQIHSAQYEDYKVAKSLYTTSRVEDIFEILLEFDLRSKGVNNDNTTQEELLREMVFRIIN